MITKVLENEKLGMKFKSKMSQLEMLMSAIAFVDDVDLVADGKEVEKKMIEMLQTYDDLHTATGGLIEQSKSKYFAWKWKWKQGNKIIEDIKVNISINNVKVNEVSCKKSEKTLGVHLSPSMKWEGQFKAMVSKMKEATYKLGKVEIAAPIAHMCYNAHLIKKVYFGSGVMSITEQQEIV